MWEKRMLETTRGIFEIFESGKGEPLAVTHLYSAFDERGNAAANPFVPYYHVYLINVRGAGNSDDTTNTDDYSMDATVLDLEAIRVALWHEKWAFLGHSTGGMLALKYAINHPSSLSKIIAGGAAASYEYGMDPGSIYCAQNPNYERITAIMDQLNDPSTPIEVRQKISYEWALMSYFSEEKCQQALKKPNSGKTVGKRLNYFRKVEYPTYDVREQLKTVEVPSYIYAGQFDSQCPLKFGIEIANLLPNATLTIFKESNHFPFLEEEELYGQFVQSTLA